MRLGSSAMTLALVALLAVGCSEDKPGSPDSGVCAPMCSGRSCGDDGCGGQCGTCQNGAACNNVSGKCEGACSPACGAGEYCDTSAWQCKPGCEADSACSAATGKPRCDMTSKACVGCLADTDCLGANKRCEPTAQVCVQCLGEGDCPDSSCTLAVHQCATAIVSSRSYKGHENERDSNAFVNAYPSTVGTRLDDCQTCHKGATFTSTSTSKKTTKNACDFCHLVEHPMTGFDEPMPSSMGDTLNPYGLAYLGAGRTKLAAQSIDGQDSDGDGAANGVEVTDLKYPGDPASKPGQPNAPYKVFTLEQLKAMPAHSELLLSNSNKQQYDDYTSYKGVKVKDLLAAAGVDTTNPAISGVTIIAPDGYATDFTIEEVNQQYPNGKFYAGLDTATLGATCGFVTYPDTLPVGLVDGGDIPDPQFMLLAYERDGEPMDPTTLDPTSGKISGEGPYRVVVPQSNPGVPDRGLQYSPTTCNDGYDYDSSKDHNAGLMVRGVVVVRINPLPAGYEDFDAKNGGWAFIANSTVMIYGHGITQ
ncbi:MAG: hypothetical protein HY901_09740 [Deltaproteobacteria bacterium]|nr:hypothetical protein [Deltaproteobacteria bacterium]